MTKQVKKVIETTTAAAITDGHKESMKQAITASIQAFLETGKTDKQLNAITKTLINDLDLSIADNISELIEFIGVNVTQLADGLLAHNAELGDDVKRDKYRPFDNYYRNLKNWLAVKKLALSIKKDVVTITLVEEPEVKKVGDNDPDPTKETGVETINGHMTSRFNSFLADARAYMTENGVSEADANEQLAEFVQGQAVAMHLAAGGTIENGELKAA